MEHADFLIRARDWSEGEILVEVNASPAGRMRDPQRAPLDRAAVFSFLHDLEQGKVPRRRLLELGQLLADTLLPAAVREMLTRSLDSLDPEQGLRLRLILDDPGLADLPWEYLHLNRAMGEPGLDGFLVLDRRISIVREEPIPLPVLPLAAAPRLRLVVGFAAPEDARPLDLEAERESIAQALEGLDRFEVSFVEHLTAETLGPAVEGAGAFHFAGHGAFSEKRGSEGFLVLEDERRHSSLFSAELLGTLLRAAGVRLVVLNACQSGRRGGARVWGGLAATLTKAGIPAVLAMQASIHDESATRFSRGLYRALAAGLSLDEAVTAGCLAALAMAVPNDIDWGLPVLYLRSPDGLLFPAEAGRAADRERIRVEIRQHAARVLGSLTGVAAGEIDAGEIRVVQDVETVGPGGQATGLAADRIGGGSVSTRQEVGTLEDGGSVTGVKLRRLR